MDQQITYENRYWESEDGLKLHYRDYSGDPAKMPVICVPGLTRNVRDFEHFGQVLNGERRIIMVNLRGRGDSEYAKDSSTYNPKQYVADIVKLMEELAIPEGHIFWDIAGRNRHDGLGQTISRQSGWCLVE